MLRTLKLALPLLLAASSAVHAQDAAAPSGSSDETVQPKEDAPETYESTETDDSDETTEVDTNTLVRQTKKTAVEVFADYSTFTSKREYFNPTALGVRAYWFQTADIKYGFSLAAEQFVYDTDLKTPTGDITSPYTFADVKRKGTAIRYAANAQYFVSDTVNATFSLFGANGKTEKKSGYKSDTYTRSGFTFGLGNQWSWDGYTFRWDWISLTYNFNLDIGGDNVLDRYPSNTNGGMIILSALAFGAEW